MNKQYFIDDNNVEWNKFLEALNSGHYTLTVCTEEEERLISGNTRAEIIKLKQNLFATDYQAIKYAEGKLTEEEYGEMKAKRQSWRDEINRLEKKLCQNEK